MKLTGEGLKLHKLHQLQEEVVTMDGTVIKAIYFDPKSMKIVYSEAWLDEEQSFAE